MTDIYNSPGGMLLGLPPQFQEAYLNDPRSQIANALQMSGMDTSPTYSPIQAVARALQGALGGYQRGQIVRDYQNAGKKYFDAEANLWGVGPQGTAAQQGASLSPGGGSTAMAQTAAALGGPQPSMGAPGPQGQPQPSQGAPQAAPQPQQATDPIAAMRQRATAAAQSQDPMIRSQGFQMLQQLASKDYESAIALKQTLAAQGKVLQPDGSVSAMPGFGAAAGQNEGAQVAAAEPFKEQAAVGMQGATLPGEVTKAGQTSYASSQASLPAEEAKLGYGKSLDLANAGQIAYKSTQGTLLASQEGNKARNDVVTQLAGDYSKDPTVDAYLKGNAARATANQALANPDNHSSDILLAQAAIQMAVPNAQMRGSNIEDMNKVTGIPQRIADLRSKITGGSALTDSDRKDLKDYIQSQWDVIKKAHDQTQRSFILRAGKSGQNINPQEYMPDFESSATPKVDSNIGALPQDAVPTTPGPGGKKRWISPSVGVIEEQ